MRIMYCSPENEPKVLKIHKTLKSISDLMQTNSFDTVFYKDMLLVYDPKGILKYSNYKQINGLKIRGPFLFTGNDTLEKDFKSLNKNQIGHLLEMLDEHQEELDDLEI